MRNLIIMVICTVLLTVPFSTFAEQPAKCEGVSRVSVSVMDLDASAAFYTDYIGLTVAGEGVLSAETVKALYGLDCAAKYVCLKNAVQVTCLELLEFEDKPTKVGREGYNSWDYGYYDISLRCADINQVYEELTGKGYTFGCPPYRYVTTWSGAEVYEAVMEGPDGVPLAMINKTAQTPEFKGMFRNFPDVVTVVNSMDEADKFYVDVLGISKVFDMDIEKGLVDPIVGTLDTDILTRIGMYMGDGQAPVVEILDFSEDGRSMTGEGASVPANAGLFATGFLIDDLDAVMAAASANGFEAAGEAVEYELAPYGAIRAAMVTGPGDALVELFEVK